MRAGQHQDNASAGQPGAHVAEAFLTLRRGVEILGAALRPGMVRAIALTALNGLSAKADWPRRREAASALAALAASIQARRGFPQRLCCILRALPAYSMRDPAQLSCKRAKQAARMQSRMQPRPTGPAAARPPRRSPCPSRRAFADPAQA